jgi:RNA recognition motif-containing protein
MKLYIGNLPWSINSDGLKKLFSAYNPDEANIITDKFTKRSKGFGFVTINDDSQANKAISEMNGKEFEGRSISVSEARPMKERGE